MAHALANAMFLYCHDKIEPVEISDIEDVEDYPELYF